jgi:hypothetical protein
MGNLSPAAQRGFFCTLAAGKLGHSPIKLLGTAAAKPGAVVGGSAGGDRERGIQQVANRPDPISDSHGNRWCGAQGSQLRTWRDL